MKNPGRDQRARSAAACAAGAGAGICVCVLGVVCIAACLAVPGTLSRWNLTNDAVEHLAIANAWVHGRGFVDPVEWTYYRSGVPYPATALRAPVISILAAAPLALGATLATVMQLHALWSSLIVGVLALVARRLGLRLPAALGAALLVGTSPAWLNISSFVWTEATGVLAFLGVLAAAGGVVRSVRYALFCAVLTVFASFCRPNLSALALAVLVAGAMQLGWRRALRSTPLWSYAVAFLLVFFGSHALLAAVTGEAPYSRYGAMFQVIHTTDAFSYAKEYRGIWAFVASQWDPILARAGATWVQFGEVLFVESRYHWLGWLAVPGFACALVQQGEHAVARRAAALSGLGFVLVSLLYTDFDRHRFPIFTAVAASLCGLAALDDFARWIGVRFGPRFGRSGRLARVLVFLPLAVALLPIVVGTLAVSASASLASWRSYRQVGTREVFKQGVDASVQAACRYIDADALVAGWPPWHYQFWCGNASIVIPVDLDHEGLLDRFLDREQPGYLITGRNSPVAESLEASERLRRITAVEQIVLYEVNFPGENSRPWRAPPPLACAGKPPSCARGFGR